MTLFRIASAGYEELEALRERYGEKIVELMQAVARIPYVCGKPTCTHPGCVEIRAAQDVVRELCTTPAPE